MYTGYNPIIVLFSAYTYLISLRTRLTRVAIVGVFFFTMPSRMSNFGRSRHDGKKKKTLVVRKEQQFKYNDGVDRRGRMPSKDYYAMPYDYDSGLQKRPCGFRTES